MNFLAIIYRDKRIVISFFREFNGILETSFGRFDPDSVINVKVNAVFNETVDRSFDRSQRRQVRVSHQASSFYSHVL